MTAKKSEWERLKKSVSEKTGETESLKNGFPGEIPQMEEIRNGITECRNLEKAGERTRVNRMTEKEEEELSSLDHFFANGVPDDAAISQIMKEASRFVEISKEQRSEQMSAAEQARPGNLSLIL